MRVTIDIHIQSDGLQPLNVIPLIVAYLLIGRLYVNAMGEEPSSNPPWLSMKRKSQTRRYSEQKATLESRLQYSRGTRDRREKTRAVVKGFITCS